MGTCPQIKHYRLTIRWFSCAIPLSVIFTRPPTKADIASVIYPRWKKLTEEQQNNSWEFVLILNFIPEDGWIGKIDTYYGIMEVSELYIFDNRNEADKS